MLAWLPYWDQSRAFKSYESHLEIITHVSFFWFYIDETGHVKKYRYAKIDPDLVATVQRNGDKAYALVANLPDVNPGHPDGNWNREIVRRMLESTESMDHHISHLIELVLSHNFDGINIDYENLRRADRKNYTRFITRLSEALKEHGKELAIALHPKTAEFNPAENNGSHAQDWTTLHQYVDQMHIMGYGQHYIGSSAGSIASADWLADILAYLYQLDVDQSKFVVGLPLYGQAWRLNGEGAKGVNRELTFSDVLQLKQNYNGEEVYLPDSQSNRLGYTDNNGNKHVVYFENQRSIREKLEVVSKWGVKNFAFWRIGGEDPAVWPLVMGH